MKVRAKIKVIVRQKEVVVRVGKKGKVKIVEEIARVKRKAEENRSNGLLQRETIQPERAKIKGASEELKQWRKLLIKVTDSARE